MLNLVLAIFNMVPAFPLDGGRVLRSILWGWRDDLRWATRLASRIGTGFGYVLLGLRRVDRALFWQIPWGGNRVLELTRQRLEMLGWSWRELEPLWDLDRPEDLERYAALGRV